jgi:thiol-disulfide isomerase/thioredoxin
MKLIYTLLFLLLHQVCVAQPVYKPGDVIEDIKITRLLNADKKNVSFTSLKKQVTIIDFFGTWCVPCVKALPQLTSLQKKNENTLAVILISNEAEARLNKFLAARPAINFAVVADADNSITNQFKPPSYPYTVVINSANKIIAVTDAAAITNENIKDWLAGKNTNPLNMVKKQAPIGSVMNSNKRSNNKLVALSQTFMYAAKTGEATAGFETSMQQLNYKQLITGLKNDDDKKAFWINAYNAFTQVLLKKDSAAYQHRNRFFKNKQIEIAGKKFSLDDIEHGILRKSKVKWSLGYFNKLFTGKLEKQLRVDTPDYRVHFALNCGAKSCPPIAFYNNSNINEQLDIAASAYLNGEAIYDEHKNTLGLPAIMGWFRNDFGGRKKMLQLVKQKGIVPENKNPKIYFSPYNWDLHLNNYQN